ncbi:MAG: ATP/GTP-binding protein [Segetibacter sp.]
MSKFVITLVIISSLLSTGLFAQKHQLVKQWETDSVLKVPESVLFDQKNNVLYVANIDGKEPWGKDGKGSIGKVGTDGKIIATEWVTGLNAPKGMGLLNNKLYVADIDRVVVIDTKKGAVVQTIPVDGAEGLNDITIDKKGIVYVSDSQLKKVHRIENGAATTWLENLQGPNGLLAYEDNLYILDNGGMYRAEKDKSLTKITDGMEGGTDGIENVAGKDFIVSCWAGSIWYVNADGSKEHLLDTRDQNINSADIGYDAKNRIVYVPTFWKNSVAAYQLK